MRLGARRTVLQTVDCIAAKLYQSEQYVDERHRHRYGVSWYQRPPLLRACLACISTICCSSFHP